MRSGVRAVAVFLSTLLLASQARAQDDWSYEITPYLWAAGTDADVTLDAQTVRVKREFVAVDLAGSVLGVGQRDRFVIWTQLDFLRLDTDELERAPAGGRLESDAFLATLGFGYQFGQRGGRTVDVLLGARHISLDSKFTLNGVGRFKRDEVFTDPLIIVRPSWPLGERWRFNPTVSLGGGDSQLTWELQPQFQWLIVDRFALRLGYRRVFYRIESDGGRNKWDGAFQGVIIGIGGMFGDR
jgi:hypothetical protein